MVKKCISLILRPYGQAVKTPPFHGGIPSSNLGRVTIINLVRLYKEHLRFRGYHRVHGGKFFGLTNVRLKDFKSYDLKRHS